MKIETYQDDAGNSTVKNVAFCDIHTPADSDVTPLIRRVNDESDAVSHSLSRIGGGVVCCHQLVRVA